jgi:low affinity Fe/Cu permease
LSQNRPVAGPGAPPARAVHTAGMPRRSPLARGFDRLSKAAARFTGRPTAFMLALLVVLAWLLTGPLFGYSDTWQLVINTGTTIVTFLMVFLIQNTQSRDTEAIQIKLDELIRVTEAASNALMDLEELDEDSLDRYRAHYEQLARDARALRRELDGRGAG